MCFPSSRRPWPAILLARSIPGALQRLTYRHHKTSTTPLVPVLSSLNNELPLPPGGQYLGITGTRFGRGQNDQSVTVGGAACDVTSWSDTMIGCRLPPLGHGMHSVEVIRGQLGLADNRCGNVALNDLERKHPPLWISQ